MTRTRYDLKFTDSIVASSYEEAVEAFANAVKDLSKNSIKEWITPNDNGPRKPLP